MSKNHSKLIGYLIVGLCFLIYGNSLLNNYGFDDEYVIVNNEKVAKGISGISALFKSKNIESVDQGYGYRPVTLTSFAVEHQIFGAIPFVSHLINLLLYILTCLLIFKILNSLFKNNHWLLPLVITVLFIVHPIHTEVVSSVKSRDELLCFLFALLAMASAIKYARKQHWGWLAGVFVFMVLSFLSKLSSLTFLAIIPLTIYFFENVNWKVHLNIVVASLLPLIIFRLINTQLIESSGSRSLLFIENPLFVNGASFIERIPMAFYSVFYYIKLLFVPHPLLSYYGYDHVSIVGWEHLYVWLGMLIVIPLAILTIWKLKTKSVLVYGLAFFFITISMYANLVKPAVGIIAERFAYIPSLGFCIVVGWLLLKLSKIDITLKEEVRIPKLNYVFWGITGLIVLAGSAKTFSRNLDWYDLQTLVTRDIEVAPKSVKLNMLLANDLFGKVSAKELKQTEKDSLIERSIFYYKQALETYPIHTAAHNNLGILYSLEGNLKESHQHLIEASRGDAPDFKSFYNLGLSYRANGDPDKAIETLKKSIALNPKSVEAYQNLMYIQFENELYEEAMETNITMFRIFPKNRPGIYGIGQKMAAKTHGPNSTYYLDLLLSKKLITPKMYETFKKQSNPSLMGG